MRQGVFTARRGSFLRYHIALAFAATALIAVTLAFTPVCGQATASHLPDSYNFAWESSVTDESTGEYVGGVAVSDAGVHVVTHGTDYGGANTVEHFNPVDGLHLGRWNKFYSPSSFCESEIDASASYYTDVWTYPEFGIEPTVVDLGRESIYARAADHSSDNEGACIWKMFGNDDPDSTYVDGMPFISAAFSSDNKLYALELDMRKKQALWPPSPSNDVRVVKLDMNNNEIGDWRVKDQNDIGLSSSQGRGIAVHGAPDNTVVYVFENKTSGGAVHKYNGSGLELDSWNTEIAKPYSTEFSLIATDECGKIYVPDPSGNTVKRYNPDGSLLQTIGDAGHLSFPSAVTVGTDGSLYVVNETVEGEEKTIVKYQTSGGGLNCLSGEVEDEYYVDPGETKPTGPAMQPPSSPQPSSSPVAGTDVDSCDVQSNLHLRAYVPREVRREDMVGKGVRIKAATSSATSGTVTLGLERKDARLLGIKGRGHDRLGTVNVRLLAREKAFYLKPGRKARRLIKQALRRNKRIKTVRLYAHFNLKGKVEGRDLELSKRSKLFRARIRGKHKRGTLKYLGSTRSEARCGKLLLIDIMPGKKKVPLKYVVSKRGSTGIGITSSLSCSEDCSGKLSLLLRGRDAASLRYRRGHKTEKLLSSKSVTLKKGAAQSFTVQVKSRLARKSLARAYRRGKRYPKTMKLKLLFTAKTFDGIHRRKSRTVTVSAKKVASRQTGKDSPFNK